MSGGDVSSELVPRTLSAFVNGNGSTDGQSAGVAVARSGVGTYTVTPAENFAFPGAAYECSGCGATPVLVQPQALGTVQGTVQIKVFNLAGALVDAPWFFTATQVFV